MCNRSEQINELSAALAKAQSEFRAAAFNATNPFLKNKYADLGAVIEAARPALTKNGLAIIQPVTITDAQVTVETILSHQSGQWISGVASMPIDAGKGMTAVQSAGSLITYLRRYGIASLVGIYADEDSDGAAPKQPAAHRQSESEPAPAESAPEIVMTLDEARSMKTSKGEEYYTLSNETLAHMATSITKKLHENGYTQEEGELMRRKLVAIRMILSEQK